MWTQEAYALVKREWANGLSAAQVARQLAVELGVRKSRNAVIGVVYRNGFKPKRNKKTYAGVALAAKRRRIKRDRARLAEKPEAYIPQPDPVASLSIPFMELRAGQCRAVTDNTRFAQRCCGHPVDEQGIYCPAHRARHYRKREAA